MLGIEAADHADHLFIKRGLLAWMAEQAIEADAVISRTEDGSRVGSDVVFQPRGRLGLQVLLDADASGRDGALQLLGPGVAHDPTQLIRQGYVNRIRCVPDGATRRIEVGTQLRSGTEWYSLGAVHLASWGVSTPAVEEIWRERAQTHLIGAVQPRREHAPVPVEPAVRGASDDFDTSADRARAFTELEQALREDHGVTVLQRALDRAEYFTRTGATSAENALQMEAGDRLRRELRGVGMQPAPVVPRTSRSRTERARRRAGARPGATTAMLPAESIDAAAAAEVPAHSATGPAVAAPAQRRAPRRQAPSYDAVDVAGAVRDVLEHAARTAGTVSWPVLCDQVPVLAGLGEDEQRKVLSMVRPTARHSGPPWSRPARCPWARLLHGLG